MLRPTSTRRMWILLQQTGAQYSAGAYTSTIVDVLNVDTLAPHPVPARKWINALHAVTMSRVFTVSQCPVEHYSEIGWCWLEGESSAFDEYIKFTFCFLVVQPLQPIPKQLNIPGHKDQ